MPFSKSTSELGAKLGPKLARLISDSIVATKLRLLDTEHRARVHSMQEIIDRAGHEVADLYRPLVQNTLDNGDLPDAVRDHLAKMASGRHQWQALAGFLIGSSGAPSALSTIMSNYLAPDVRALVNLNPQLAPNPELMAEMEARGVFPHDEVHQLSRGDGYSDDIVNALVEMSHTYPDISTTLELLRRGLIDRSRAELYMTRNGIPASVHGQMLSLAEVKLSPADLADMVVRGIVNQGEGAKIAAESGVSAADFDKLVLDTGEPLALEQLLEAFRRHFIDQARLERGIRQGRTRDEWIDVATKLRYTPMSVADAVNAVVQGHLSMAAGEERADFNGLEPGEFATLYQTAGEPLSRTEMEQLFNRGLVSEAEVEQALRESRLKNKYIPSAFQLHQHVIPIYTLLRAIQHGGIPNDEAVRIAMESGYSKHDSELIVKSGSVTKTDPHRTAVVGAISGLYEENALTNAKASDLISRLGFDKAEADFIIQAAELRRQARAIGAAVTAVRSKYLARHITKSEASGKLDGIGIPAERRDYLLHLWAIEQAATVKTLTPAQVVAGFKKGLIPGDDAEARLIADGYSKGDAILLLEGA